MFTEHAYGDIIPKFQLAYTGTNVSIQCYSMTPPKWYKYFGKTKRFIIKSPRLKLTEVTLRSSGIYVCEGRGIKRNRFFKTSELKVGGKYDYY